MSVEDICELRGSGLEARVGGDEVDELRRGGDGVAEVVFLGPDGGVLGEEVVDGGEEEGQLVVEEVDDGVGPRVIGVSSVDVAAEGVEGADELLEPE